MTGKNRDQTLILIYDKDEKWTQSAAKLLSDEGFAVETETENFQKCIDRVVKKTNMVRHGHN